MIRLDWSSFKFRMNDGAVIEQLTGEIDSVFLSDPTLRTSAEKIPSLTGRIQSISLKPATDPVMLAKAFDEKMLRITIDMEEGGKKLMTAGALLASFIGLEALAILAPIDNPNDQTRVVLALGGLGCFVGSSVYFISAGKRLRNIPTRMLPYKR